MKIIALIFSIIAFIGCFLSALLSERIHRTIGWTLLMFMNFLLIVSNIVGR